MRRIVALVVVAAVVTAIGLVSWDRLWRHAGPANPGFNCPEVVKARHRLPFTATKVAISAGAACQVARTPAS